MSSNDEMTTSNPMDDWRGFYEELQHETPRAAVLLAAAYLDAHLRQLIANFLIDDDEEVNKLLGDIDGGRRGPLSNFAPRIQAAYCLGLIGDNEYHDLNLIRKIRNQFAHKLHGFSMDDPEVVGWCSSLKSPQAFLDAIPDFPGRSPSSRFMLAVVFILSRIGLDSKSIKKQRRK